MDELNAKYDVPRAVGAAWVVNDQALPLLDGLDEVDADARKACAEAINAFRQSHGLLPMVVCSRIAEYEALAVRLNLQGAILIHPLTQAQIDSYLASSGPQSGLLQSALQQDPTLRELAETPLFLRVMGAISQTLPVSGPEELQTLEERRRLLFDAYVEQMFARRSAETHYSPQQIRASLAWLAQAMMQRSQTIFFLERLQPDWLQTCGLRRLYNLIDRIGTGLLVGVPMSLFIVQVYNCCFSIALGPDEGQKLGYINGLAFLLLFGMIAGLFGGKQFGTTRVLPAFWWLSRSAWLSWLIFGFIGGVIGFVGRLYFGLRTDLNPLEWGAIFWAHYGMVGLIAGGIAGAAGVHPRRITLVETLRWSWSKALRSIPITLGIGFVSVFLGFLFTGLFFLEFQDLKTSLICSLVAGALGGLNSWLLGGLVSGELNTKAIPNQGIWRSARSAALSSLIFGLGIGLIIGLGAGLGVTLFPNRFLGQCDAACGLGYGLGYLLFWGSSIGMIVGLSFGGYACLSHLTLRLVLWRSGALPLRLVSFLDHCAERIFLRKVGGGYIFVHRLLLEYFADLDITRS